MSDGMQTHPEFPEPIVCDVLFREASRDSSQGLAEFANTRVDFGGTPVPTSSGRFTGLRMGSTSPV